MIFKMIYPWICCVWLIRFIILKIICIGFHDEVLRIGVQDVRKSHYIGQGSSCQSFFFIWFQLHFFSNFCLLL